MADLSERDRNVMIALGVLQGRVIDARRHFDQDFIEIDLPDVVTTTVFEGVYGPGDVA
jgi:hypothetical protein